MLNNITSEKYDLLKKLGGLIFVVTFIILGKYLSFIPGWMSGIAIWTLLVIGYYGFLYKGLCLCDVDIWEILQKDMWKILLLSAASIAFISLEIKATHEIRIWDGIEVWDPAIRFSALFFDNPYDALRALRASINQNDYNDFIPMLISMPMCMVGNSFFCYIVYISMMFLMPAAICFGAVANEFGRQMGKEISCVNSAAIFLIAPPVIAPMLYGYANVSILLPGIIMFLCFMRMDLRKMEYDKMLIISGEACLAVIQARTAAYLVVGMFLGYALYVFCHAYPKKEMSVYIIALIKKYAFAFLVCISFFFLFFRSFLYRNLTYDIATAYAGYAKGYVFFERLILTLDYIGAILLVIAVSGIIIGVRKKYSFYGMFFLVWIVSAIVLVSKVQIMENQHLYTILIPILFSLIFCLSYLKDKMPKLKNIALVFLGLNFLQAFCGIFPFHIAGEAHPSIRYDINEMRRVVGDLRDLTEENDWKAYFVASSERYNCNTLQKIDLPNQYNAVPQLLPTHDVDLRDGFPVNFLKADIVLVALPLQTHLMPDDQQVIGKLLETMEQETPISRHFTLLKEYELYPDCWDITQLENNEKVTIKVYKKINQFTKDDISYLQDVFDQKYQSYPKLFRDRFEEYKGELNE